MGRLPFYRTFAPAPSKRANLLPQECFGYLKNEVIFHQSAALTCYVIRGSPFFRAQGSKKVLKEEEREFEDVVISFPSVILLENTE